MQCGPNTKFLQNPPRSFRHTDTIFTQFVQIRLHLFRTAQRHKNLHKNADILSKKPAMQIVLAEVTICSSTRCMINICRSEAKCALSMLIPLWQVSFWRFTPQPLYVKAKPGSSNPYTGLGRPLRFQKIEAPRISLQSAHCGGKVVSPTHCVTGISGSSPDMYRRFRFKSWYVPAFQVQPLNGLRVDIFCWL
jgi:hypothetical protein